MDINTELLTGLAAALISAAQRSVILTLAVFLLMRFLKRTPLRRWRHWVEVRRFIPWVLGLALAFSVGGVTSAPMVEGWNYPFWFWTAIYGLTSGEIAVRAQDFGARILGTQKGE